MHPAARRVTFVLLPPLSLLSLGGALEALKVANRALGSPAYEVRLLSLDGQPVADSIGSELSVQGRIDEHDASLDELLVLATDAPPLDQDDRLPAIAALLKSAAQRGRTIGTLGSAASWAARAGVLAGRRTTLPWREVRALAERHLDVVVSSNVFEIDTDRLSCAGGGASLDMMIAWLGRRHGQRLVQQLVAHFGLTRLRAADERQPTPSAALPGASSKLAEAIALMEANLGEPLATEDIAQLVGVSRRQLERLFKQHLDALPSRWYTELRLAQARRLLQESSQSILQIGLACGFSSGPRFSNAYRAHFGRTPRDERAGRAAAWRSAAPVPPASPGPVADDSRGPQAHHATAAAASTFKDMP
jgi:transcriptional regulator GlxA family with amidase domain